jgi:hypothetical protein
MTEYARCHSSARAWLGLLLAACTPSSPEREPPAESIEPPPPKPERVPSSPPSSHCEPPIGDYLAERAKLSHCEADSDCAEMWPGLCPYGPYYIHRDADIAPILERERDIMANNCGLPNCEPPMELGIAHCEHRKCVPGRAAPPSNTHESCWDYRETWLEPDGTATSTTSSMIQGITPHVAIAPAAAGTLYLDVYWPDDCFDCRLLISEHNSGMAQLMTPESLRKQSQRNGVAVTWERLELPVTPGPYHMVGMAAKDVNYTIHAELRDVAGDFVPVTRHGVGWQRMCEG